MTTADWTKVLVTAALTGLIAASGSALVIRAEMDDASAKTTELEVRLKRMEDNFDKLLQKVDAPTFKKLSQAESVGSAPVRFSN